LSDLRRACLEVGLPLDEVQTLTEWGEDPSFLDALAARVHSAWQEAASFTSAGIPHLVISAHGVPESYVRRGDPYVDQIHASVRGLLKRLPENVAHTLCFQSRATPFKWVGPATDATLKKLAEEGNHNLVILPISFINDHVETLFEIDHELTNIAKAAGAQRVTRVPAFNDDADLVTVLAGLVQQKVVVATPTLP
jgi:ferrochelatase